MKIVEDGSIIELIVDEILLDDEECPADTNLYKVIWRGTAYHDEEFRNEHVKWTGHVIAHEPEDVPAAIRNLHDKYPEIISIRKLKKDIPVIRVIREYTDEQPDKNK